MRFFGILAYYIFKCTFELIDMSLGFIKMFQARFGWSGLDEKIGSYGWDLIPILGGKVRIGTDASFDTERT